MKCKKGAETPLMKQFYDIKAQYPGAVLFFRVGDFYETFGEDAVITSKVLGIVLTRRSSGNGTYTELAGVPYHAIDTYLPKLVRAGYKVAICDQLEDPKLTKKIVKRGVTELVTPGVAYNDTLLQQKEHNYLAALYFNKVSRKKSPFSEKGEDAGIALLDISTGTFKIAQGSLDYIEVLLASMSPKEVLVEKGYQDGFRKRYGSNAYISTMDEWAFVFDSCRKKILSQFDSDTLKGFGVENMPLGISAAGAILFYLELTKHDGLGHIKSISRIDEGEYVWMDKFTFRNLEVFSSLTSGDNHSLLSTIDKCCSPMGARLLREWIAMPLKDVAKITERYDIVSSFFDNATLRDKVREEIGEIGDLERIVSKAASGRITPREALQLARGLKHTAEIKQLLQEEGAMERSLRCARDDSKEVAEDSEKYQSCKVEQSCKIEECCKEDESCKTEKSSSVLDPYAEALDGCAQLYQKISSTILPDCASQIGKGDVIARGISQELDMTKETMLHSKEILLDIQQREKDRTGITSLKVGFNNVYGYYLEVRNTHSEKVPPEWMRKQTLVGAERYITAELKEHQDRILGAEGRIFEIEQQIYSQIVAEIQNNISAIQKNASTVARLDVLSSFATLAISNNYCRPDINNSLEISIKQGRHPVIETMMDPGEEYIANDLYLNNDDQQIIVLTGPNMAGKSAFLRQTALIVLLAQIGSFVPAQEAHIGFVDKIFTRVGASDNISKGESTFMVEMLESATILNNLSQRSLILFDEIGRGTSTYDGMSIAWAIVEYLHEGEEGDRSPAPKTLFATHYHELNELEGIYPRVHNYHISAKEVDGKVIFLRKLCKGGVAHSFGINVAKLAGMPGCVVQQAQRKLKSLERASQQTEAKEDDTGIQLSLFQLDDPLLLDIRNELKKIDINTLSPLAAFDTIREIKRKMGM